MNATGRRRQEAFKTDTLFETASEMRAKTYIVAKTPYEKKGAKRELFYPRPPDRIRKSGLGRI